MYTPDAALAPAATSSQPLPRLLGQGLARNGPTYRDRSVAWLDLLALSLALLAVVLRIPLEQGRHNLKQVFALRISVENLCMAVACLALWVIILRASRVIINRSRDAKLMLLGLVARVAICTALAAILLLVRHPAMATPLNLALFFGISLLLLTTARITEHAYIALIEPAIRRERTAVIVGAWQRGQEAADLLRHHPRWNYKLRGFIDSDPPTGCDSILGPVDSLETVLMHDAIDEVIIALPIKSMYDQIQIVIATCERLGVQSRYSTDLFDTTITKKRSVDIHHPSFVLLHMVHGDVRHVLKRFLDVSISFFMLLCLSPLLLIIAACIKFSSRGPVFFRQQRYGLNKRLFTLYKFRSMVVDAESLQHNLEHLNETTGPVFKMKIDPRVTKIGGFIRRTSLDELPQLWNVLTGDMSLVGPRPLPLRDVSRFSEGWLMRRFSVLPGITGLWQVSGRSNANFETLIALDLDYIDRWSLLLDFEILARTLPAVVRQEGAA